MTTAGLIFSNIHDQSIPEMTRRRTMASIPFGCRYRLVDFALSNMVNSNITNVGIITHYNYRSLLDHIGTGKDWDLARRSGGIKLLPPYVTAYENNVAGKLYESRLEAIVSAGNFINRCNADYIVLSDCDVILNIDLNAVVEEHIRTNAFVTIVTKRLNTAEHHFDGNVGVITMDDEGCISEIASYKPTDNAGNVDISTNIMVISRKDLQTAVSDAVARGYKNFWRDIVAKHIEEKRVRAYRFDGFYAYISSLESYFKISMQLLEDDARHGLFAIPNRQIYTKLRNSAPVKYASDAKVKNSLVADGCVIEGTVENSILFRGVHVGKGTVVRNSILLQDSYVGTNVNLNCVITDKNVVIKDDRNLSGHETMPFFIEKGTMV